MLNPPFQRRSATSADIAFLIALRQSTMQAHFENAGLPYERETQRERVLADFGWAEIILCEGTPIGLVKLDKGDNPWHLHQIQLMPTMQGRGIGSRLMGDLLAEAAREGVAIELKVLKGNPAKGLYQRLGFVMVEERHHSFRLLWQPALPNRQDPIKK